MKRDHTRLMFIISILVTIVFSLALFYFFKLITNKNTSTVDILSTLSKNMAQKNNTEVLLKKSEELEKTDELVNSYFIDSSKISDFVDSLDKLGQNNNTQIKVLNVAVPQNAKNTIMVKLSIVGNFNNVMRTVYLLEDSPFFVDITQAFVNVNKIQTPVGGNKDNSKTTKVQTKTSWEADITFNVLSLSNHE